MLRSKGENEKKYMCKDVTWAAQLKRIIAGRTLIPKTARSHQDVGISFFSFFYFVLFVLNSEPCQKWFPHRHWRCLVTPFRDVNYGSGEVRVSLFFWMVACVLVLEVKSWKNDFLNENWCLVLIFGWVLRENYGLYLDFFVIFTLKFQSMSSSISRSSICFN